MTVRTPTRPVRAWFAVGAVGLAMGILVAGCGSSPSSDASRPTSTSGSTAGSDSNSDARVTVTVPDLPAGTQDCGESDELAGWPTTTTLPLTSSWTGCILDAFAAGTPARFVIVAPGKSSSGHRTNDGYDIPARRITIWTVTGPSEIEVVTDFSADGGKRTTRTCSQLPPVDTGWPEPANCSP